MSRYFVVWTLIVFLCAWVFGGGPASAGGEKKSEGSKIVVLPGVQPQTVDPTKPGYYPGTRTDMGKEQFEAWKLKIGRSELQKARKKQSEQIRQNQQALQDYAETCGNAQGDFGILFVAPCAEKGKQLDQRMKGVEKPPANASQAFDQWWKKMLSGKDTKQPEKPPTVMAPAKK